MNHDKHVAIEALGRISGVLWALGLGGVALFVFFAAIGTISPGEVKWITAGVIAIAAASLAHFIHVRHALADPRHGELARRVHSMREHRGF
jgi:hypothetical protein